MYRTYHKLNLFLVILLLLTSCEKGKELQEELYETAIVSHRDIDITVEAAGIIEPETTVEVKSKASGEILTLNAETGDYIKEGTLLVQIDKRTPRNSVDQSQADLDAAIARRKIAITQLNRTKSLLDKGIITDVEYETAELEVANAEAAVISRTVDLENARIALDDTDIRAPISGIIIEKNIERGQVISSSTRDVGEGTILLKMADLSTVLVRTLVDETDIGKIRPGTPVTVIVAAFPNQPFTGEVLKIEPQAVIDQNVTMFPVIIRLENEYGLLRPGMNAEVNINIAHAENVLAIPTMALRTERDVVAAAMMIGMDEPDLRQKISDSRNKLSGIEKPFTTKVSDTMNLGTREVLALPEVNPEQTSVEQINPHDSEPAGNGEIQRVSQSAERPGFGSGDGYRDDTQSRSGIEYAFGGNYWVVVLQNGNYVPRAVRTGITDFGYTEIISGLNHNEEVILLPSSESFERQEMIQDRIRSRLRMPGM